MAQNATPQNDPRSRSWPIFTRRTCTRNTSSTASSTDTVSAACIAIRPLDVVSLFVEQRGEGDLVPERAKRHPGMKVYPTVARRADPGHGQAGGRRRRLYRRARQLSTQREGTDRIPAVPVLSEDGGRVPFERPVCSLFQR